MRSGQEHYWRPSVDVYRCHEGWLLKFDLAGVREEDISVEAQGCHVRVSGIRRDWKIEEIDSYYSMEISYNRFERTVELPCQFRNPLVALEARDGIVIVRLREGDK